MIQINGNWEKDKTTGTERTTAEYSKVDFYGPFVTLQLKKSKDGTIEVTPTDYKIETAEVSCTDFVLLSEASRELYRSIGEFILKAKLFDVIISCEATEMLLIDKLKGIRLF